MSETHHKQRTNAICHRLFSETRDVAKALETRFVDIDNPVSSHVATAFIVYNLLRGLDVEKNIELGANLMLCGRSVEDVFSIAAQEPLNLGVIQYFWPQILKQGDPDSVSLFLKSLYESSTAAQNPVLPTSPREWIYGQLLNLPMDDTASLIHNILKYGAVDVVNDLLKRLYMDRNDGFEIHQRLFLRHGERFYIDPGHVTNETQIFVVVQSHSGSLFEWMGNPFLSHQKRESLAVLGSAVDDILTECARNILLQRHHSSSPDDPALIRRITLSLNERVHLASDDDFIQILDQFIAEDLDVVGLELRITRAGTLQVSEKNEPQPLWTASHSQEKNVSQTQLVTSNKRNRDFNGSDGVHRQVVSYLLNGQSTMAFYQIIGTELRWSRLSLLRLKGELFSQLLDGYHYAVDLSILARQIISNGDLLLQVRFIRALSEMKRLDEYLSQLIKQDESTAKLILRSAAVLGNDDVLSRLSNVYNTMCADNPEISGLIEFVLNSDDENQDDAASKIIQQKQMSSLIAYEDLLTAMKRWRQDLFVTPEMEPKTSLAGLIQAVTSPQLPLNIRNRFLGYVLKQIDRYRAGADILNLFKSIESTLSDSHRREYLRLRRKQCKSNWPMMLATGNMLFKWVQARDEHALPALLEIFRQSSDPHYYMMRSSQKRSAENKKIDMNLSWLNEDDSPFRGAGLTDSQLRLLMHWGVTQFQGVFLQGCDFAGTTFDSKVRFDNANFRGASFVEAIINSSIISSGGLAMQERPFQGTLLDNHSFKVFLNTGVRDFRGALFCNIDIKQIDLRGVDLRDVTWLSHGFNRHGERYEELNSSEKLRKKETQQFWSTLKGKRNLLLDAKLDKSSYQALYDSGLRDFSNADLSGVDFSGINLREVNFSAVHINSILKTRHISLEGTKLDEHALKRLCFAGIKNFRGADFSSTTFTRGFSFRKEAPGIDLTGADFSYAVLEGTDWSYACLERINFSHAWLQGADFNNSWVVRTNFDDAHVDSDILFRSAHFRDCSQRNVSFRSHGE